MPEITVITVWTRSNSRVSPRARSREHLGPPFAHQRIQRIQRTRGITLIELIVVLAVMALATTLVGPSVGNTVDNMRFRSFGRQLEHTLRSAQQEARLVGEERLVLLTEDRLVVSDRLGVVFEEIAWPRSVVPSPGGATYVVLGSGHLIGPARFLISSRTGRRGTLEVRGPEIDFLEGVR